MEDPVEDLLEYDFFIPPSKFKIGVYLEGLLDLLLIVGENGVESI
jgi:hypothetical protein